MQSLKRPRSQRTLDYPRAVFPAEARPLIRASTVIRSAAVLLALGLMAASLAWACIPQPLLVVEPSATARVGDKVTVRGVNFRGLSEIRLNGLSGPRLATGRGEQFTIRVAVPEVRPGLYVLVGVSRDPTGGLAASASTPLQVVSSRPGAATAPAPATSAGGEDASPSSSSGIDPLPAAAAGLGLLALGVLLGALLVRSRRRAGLR